MRSEEAMVDGIRRELSAIVSGPREFFTLDVRGSRRYVQASYDADADELLAEASADVYLGDEATGSAGAEALASAGWAPPCEGRGNHHLLRSAKDRAVERPTPRA